MSIHIAMTISTYVSRMLRRQMLHIPVVNSTKLAFGNR